MFVTLAPRATCSRGQFRMRQANRDPKATPREHSGWMPSRWLKAQKKDLRLTAFAKMMSFDAANLLKVISDVRKQSNALLQTIKVSKRIE